MRAKCPPYLPQWILQGGILHLSLKCTSKHTEPVSPPISPGSRPYAGPSSVMHPQPRAASHTWNALPRPGEIGAPHPEPSLLPRPGSHAPRTPPHLAVAWLWGAILRVRGDFSLGVFLHRHRLHRQQGLWKCQAFRSLARKHLTRHQAAEAGYTPVMTWVGSADTVLHPGQGPAVPSLPGAISRPRAQAPPLPVPVVPSAAPGPALTAAPCRSAPGARRGSAPRTLES